MRKYILLATIVVVSACQKNQPPYCAIITPKENDVYLLEDSLNISIEANDSDGNITEVRLYFDEVGLLSLKDWPYAYTIYASDFTPGNYMIEAIAYDNEGMQTSDEVQIKIGALPKVSTNSVVSIEFESATVSGIVIDSGSEPIIETGIYLDTVTNPEVSGEKIIIGNSIGEFSDKLTGLEFGTTYFIKAFAANSHGESLGSEEQFTTYTGVKDIDGNLYRTIQIGEQWWMVENLAVTKYSDGDVIPNVTDASTWASLTSAAYCWYENDEANYKDLFGALYNGFTVETGKLCPSGWHVSTDEDWRNLELFLGMSESDAIENGWRGTNQGGILKESGVENWESPNLGAVNTYRFSAMPGGARVEDNRDFDGLGLSGWYWTSTHYITENEMYRRIFKNTESRISRTTNYRQRGISVRCVKDKE